jgi:hypothetical protein
MTYREILFEIVETVSGKKYRIYENGETEGFPEGTIVANRYGMVRDAILRRYASANGIAFDPESPMKLSTDPLVGVENPASLSIKILNDAEIAEQLPGFIEALERTAVSVGVK